MLVAESIRVRGQVQGVGFRPFVWHLARRLGIRGRVWNDGDGVCIQAWGNATALRDFRHQLRANPPLLARIDALDHATFDSTDMPEAFVIVDSRPGQGGMAFTPDAAVCPACLQDVLNPADRHHRYPLTSCSHCGPRLSIVRGIPYDRANTSMAAFAMCPACLAEYENPGDRRFHAQAHACPVCGPRVWLEDAEGRRLHGRDGEAVDEAARLIREGQIVAIKGIGGIHLAVDAVNAEAVARLRAHKHRDAKPLALMARDARMIAAYAEMGEMERRLLTGSEAPIVLLDRRRDGERLAAGIAPGQHRLGFMLPYTPLHALLMQELAHPIVLTSGNRSDEPQCTDNDGARRRLAGIADAWLLHEREIVNRLDDSVVVVAAARPRVLRRARGYAPASLMLPPGFGEAPPVLAMGGELKHTFCLLGGGQAVLSQHMGDLEHAEAFLDCRKNLDLYRSMFNFRPQAVAVDMHPDYLSARLGREQAQTEEVPLAEVQHHHAHIAACMAEHGVPLVSPPVLGIALDGLGYGADGTLWGGEFLEATYAGFARLACFRPVAMPGGSQAVREPWRNAFAHLHALGWERVRSEFENIDIVRFLAGQHVDVLQAMVEKNLNSPPASSCGRLFDAVAAVLGICRERASYEGQAAIELESLAMSASGDCGAYPFCIEATGEGLHRLGWDGMWPALLNDIRLGADAAQIAARFHRTVIDAVTGMALRLSEERQLSTVVLGGGAFQNRLLLAGIVDALQQAGLEVLAPERIPANDGGLSLGQAAVAAARMLQND
jgi:hydrogenase maturation protein HypF